MDRVGAVVARWFVVAALLLPSVMTGLITVLTASTVNSAEAATPRTGTAPPRAEEPLGVSIDTLTPSVIPTTGAIRVTGTITNDSTDTWDNIGIYPLTSFDPLTTTEQLTAAVRSDPAEPVGDRITSQGPFTTIETLAPGASATYSLRVPRRILSISGAAGVYWFGVQALGEVGGVREEVAVADGRARTFLPYLPPPPSRQAGGVRGTQIATDQVRTALVLPIRNEVTRQPDGRVTDVEAWTATLGPEGRLQSLLDFGRAAGNRPLTWLVDPAVPDTATRLAAGNLPFDLTSNQVAPGTEPDGEATPSGETDPSDTPAPSPTTEPEEAPEPGDNTPPPPEPGATEQQSAVAATWAEQLVGVLRAAGSSQVLSLPYGDLDVAATAVTATDLLTSARERADTAMERLGVDTRPAIAPPGGSLPPEAYSALPLGQTILVTPRTFAEDAPARATVDGRILTTAPYAASGPGPNEPRSLISLRQMILSQAALELVQADQTNDSSTTHSLVVQLPSVWQPPGTAVEAAAFFAGFDNLDWFQLTDVATAANQPPQTVAAADLVYPTRQEERELPPETVSAGQDLISSGQSLQTTLTRNNLVAVSVLDAALTAVSYSDRKAPRTARVTAERNQGWIEGQLSKITISAPPSLTLSSGSGPLPATVSNGLDYPVTVRIIGETTKAVSITGPQRLRLGPGERVAIKLQVSTTEPGVSNVTLLVADVDDVPLGGSTTLPVRSTEVGNIVWFIIGIGVALLFAAIVVRWIRRLRGTPVGDS